MVKKFNLLFFEGVLKTAAYTKWKKKKIKEA
jgi:hypothetical protein